MLGQVESWLQGGKPVKDNEDDNVLIVRDLMKTYGPEIIKLAFTYVRDWGRAEEIMMDVFFKCYLKMDTFRGDSSIKTWLYRITINRCKDIMRSQSFRYVQPASHLNFSLERNTPSAEDVVFHRSEQEELVKAVLSLPSKYREVLILYYYSDVKIDEISIMIGKNPKTVRTRMRRAKLLLEQKLLKEDVDRGR